MGSQSGTVKNHPNWRENFRLALRLQQTLEVMYPGLARPIVLASKLYNQNLTTGSLLIEMGTESNTLSEAEYSAELTANALVSLLNTLR
jgi:stage II sporulation protein P